MMIYYFVLPDCIKGLFKKRGDTLFIVISEHTKGTTEELKILNTIEKMSLKCEEGIIAA